MKTVTNTVREACEAVYRANRESASKLGIAKHAFDALCRARLGGQPNPGPGEWSDASAGLLLDLQMGMWHTSVRGQSVTYTRDGLKKYAMMLRESGGNADLISAIETEVG